MMPLRRFTIHQPKTVVEAAQMLAEFGEQGRLYAGGTELLLAMKHDLLRYQHLVDVKTIAGLDTIELKNDALMIGGSATHRAIERSPLVKRYLPVIAEMETHVATVRVEKLITGAYETSLAGDELLTGVEVPLPSSSRRTAYLKFQLKERPTLGLALVLDVDGDTIKQETAVVCTGSAVPTQSLKANQLLAGARTQVEKQLTDAAEALAQAADPVDDLEGGADYKRHLVGVFLRRAFTKALA